MRTEYIMAVEKKLAWRRLFDSGKALEDWQQTSSKVSDDGLDGWQVDMFETIRDNLHSCDTYYVNQKFCSMVDHARIELPLSLKFDSSWVPSECGLVVLGNWFQIPRFLVEGEAEGGPMTEEELKRPWIGSLMFGKAEDGSIFCLSFLEKKGDPIPFPLECYFLRHGMSCRECLDGAKGDGNEFWNVEDSKHPIRLVFTLFYLMAQKLAVNLREPVTDRALIRRAEKAKQEIPDDIRVITLRRLEAARKADPRSVEVNWNWQWEVRGHWRNQYHPSTGEHEEIYIEAYVKGPEDKPLKHCPNRLFLAAR